MTTIAIFGTGSALRDFLSILPEDIGVVGLGDNNVDLHGHSVLGHKVYAPDDFAALPFDLCVIAARPVDSIRAQLSGLGIPPERVAAYCPSYSEAAVSLARDDVARMNSALGLGLPLPGVATMYLWPERESSPGSVSHGQINSNDDFVRRQSLKLAAQMLHLRGVPGAIAELGVYQGETAALLNDLFPDRPLHLFDTFTGFTNIDVAVEATQGYSEARIGDFCDTDTARVLARMPHPGQVTFHKGFFPDSAQELEQRFALVSLDVDLYAPTLAGLEWFYDRLNAGGYIFIHDYNNRRYTGVRQAVEAFLARVPALALPLPDFAGSLVILR